MKLILILALSILISGCASSRIETQKEIVIEYQYIIRTASAAQKAKPAYAQDINVKTATQLDLANWIKSNEERASRLESIIDELIKFYERPMTPTILNSKF